MDVRRSQRVLMTADTIGGVWNYAVELAGALDRRGVLVALATMGAPMTATQRGQLANLRMLTVHERSFKLEWMQRPWDDVDRASDWLLALEREVRPDVVHLNQYAFGALPFCAPKLVVAHSCVLSWWQAVHGEPAPAAWDKYRRRVGHGLAAANLVVAPTRAMLQTLVSNYRYTHAALLIGNARSAVHFKPAPKEPCILAAGRLWDAGKNLSALEAVAPRLDWEVRLAGSALHPDGGRRVLDSHVCCLGDLPPHALARQLAVASIYALPARYEPFGLSVLEAALSACALVLGDIPSLREIWGPAALYVAPDDHEQLRTTLAHLVGNPTERIRLGQAARARALHFTPARMTDAYLDAYKLVKPLFAGGSIKELLCA